MLGGPAGSSATTQEVRAPASPLHAHSPEEACMLFGEICKVHICTAAEQQHLSVFTDATTEVPVASVNFE